MAMIINFQTGFVVTILNYKWNIQAKVACILNK